MDWFLAIFLCLCAAAVLCIEFYDRRQARNNRLRVLEDIVDDAKVPLRLRFVAESLRQDLENHQ
jgi:uncharacterized protein (UPF0147 family)